MNHGGRKWWTGGTAVVVWIALGTVVVHVATGWRYGFARDELMALDDARNLAWGYVPYPPMTVFLGWMALKLFGPSLLGIRLFPALAQAGALVLTGMMAKELGGNRWAMVVATLAGVPFCLGGGGLLQYMSFDYLCWVWVSYCVGRVVSQSGRVEEFKSGREAEEGLRERIAKDGEENERPASLPPSGQAESGPYRSEARHGDRADMGRSVLRRYEQNGARWWVGVGVGMGLGMLAKYTMGFLAAGVVVGVLATDVRKYLRSVWLWVGVALAWLIFLPNLVWEWNRNFVSLEFLRFLHARDVATGVTDWFLLGQLELTMLMAPLALAGLVFCFGRVKEFKSARGEEEPKTHPPKTRVGHPSGERKGNSKLENGKSEEVGLRDRGGQDASVEILRCAQDDRLAVGGGGDEAQVHKAELGHSLETQEHRQECLCHRRWRILGWMYVAPLVLLLVMRGRDYYLAPAYPMLYAAGAVWVERKWREKSERVEEFKSRRVEGLRDGVGQDARVGVPSSLGVNLRFAQDDTLIIERKDRGRVWRRVIWVALLVDIVVAGAVSLPIAPIGTRWWKVASKVDLVFADEIGWPEFVEGVAKVRDALPAEDRGRVGILAGNYGEVGALHLYGEKYGLPRAISGVNSSWERGYGDSPEVLIVMGYPRVLLEQEFASCVVAGRTRNRYDVANEETVEDPEIYVCRGLKESWEVFWGKVRKFA